MKKQQLEEILRDYIREQLSEMSTTASVGGYLTKNAFSPTERDNLATGFLKKMGWKKVNRPTRPSSTKLVDYR